MGISSIGLDNREIRYATGGSGLITKSYQVGKNTLRYLVQNKYALAVSIWSYVVIEVGSIATEAIQEGYIYDVDSCRERLCDYWNNSTIVDAGFAPNYLASRCRSNEEESPYSFMKCLQDLCKYTKSIGEKFYACPKLPEIPNTIVTFWNKFCPKKGNTYPDKLSELSYLNKCIKKLCKNKKMKPFLNKNILELCETKSLDKLYELFEEINETLNKLQMSMQTTDTWTKIGIIAGIIAGLGGLIGGAAGIATVIVTYQATQAATAVLGETVPTLSEGLQSIARSTADTAVALLRQTTSQVGEMIPLENLESLQQLSIQIEERSLSYYSIEETIPHKVESGNLGNINGLDIPGAIAAEAGGADLAGGPEIIESVVGSGLLKHIIANLPSQTTTREAQVSHVASLSTMLSTLESTHLYSQTPTYAWESSTSSIPQISEITKKWIAYMKNTLPYWHNSFCFYEKFINFFVCRLPLPRHRTEKVISFFILEIQKFFSENVTALCHYFRADLWCNWNHFLELICSKRNVSFFMDKNCPWDEFALRVNPVQNDTYRIDAIGNCHNETILIRV